VTFAEMWFKHNLYSVMN